MNFVDIARVVAVAKDAMTGIAAVTAAVVAAMGLRTWKRQLFGNTNYELARRLLRSAYRVREAIRWVRSPLILPAETASALRGAGLSDSPPGGFDDRGEELVYRARWQKVSEANVEFWAEMLEAEALWGPEVRQRGDALASCTGQLYAALWRWLSRRQSPINPDRMDEIEAIIYNAGNSSTKFDDDLKAALEGIEAQIRPHLKF